MIGQFGINRCSVLDSFGKKSGGIGRAVFAPAMISSALMIGQPGINGCPLLDRLEKSSALLMSVVLPAMR
jgi:hypothetical protein